MLQPSALGQKLIKVIVEQTPPRSSCKACTHQMWEGYDDLLASYHDNKVRGSRIGCLDGCLDAQTDAWSELL